MYIPKCIIQKEEKAITRANAVYMDDNIQKIRYVKSLNINEPFTIEEQQSIKTILKAYGFKNEIIFK